MWLIPHMFGFSHTCVVKSTYYTGSSCVAFTTQVCFIAHTCGNNQTCVENPHRQVLGFFHTCLVKHTQRLISPWANGVMVKMTGNKGPFIHKTSFSDNSIKPTESPEKYTTPGRGQGRWLCSRSHRPPPPPDLSQWIGPAEKR